MIYDHVHVGSQDISRFGAGTYTGEVPAHSLQDLVKYALVGHSERHKYGHETQNSVDQKTQNAADANIEPIVLVRDEKDM
ncbi:triose-phosphate isomerase, partial [Klebsiella pneumoniae]|uniref:triose-phosphate isomerase n=1 Tax=Klebsiella pneumoniae TaxID=573 RepID=UPI00200D8193